jgi:hypothetical protein
MSLIQSGSTVWTYQDGMEHLFDGRDHTRTAGQQRAARRAILQAYRELPQKHYWNYFQRRMLLQTVDSYSTGTIAVDVTGGTYERMVTLTTGTWPTWAASGRIIIGGVHYEINRRESASVITLQSYSCPASDVASGTTYEIYQSAYPLPVNFRRLRRCYDVSQNLEIRQVTPTSEHSDSVNVYTSPQTPWECTVRGSDDNLGGLSLILTPPPSTATTYDILYDAMPQPLAVDVYSTGTITLGGGMLTTATVTGSGTTFPVDCAGCILRISSSATAPSSIIGDLSNDNRFVEQHVIKSRDSATALTLEDALGSAVSGKGYTISSPIDLDAGAMFTAFLRMAEAEYMRLGAVGGPNGWQASLPAVQMALREAMENDARLARPMSPGPYNPFRNVSVTQE